MNNKKEVENNYFGLKNPKKNEEKGRRTIWARLDLLVIAGLFLLYPFVIIGGIPFAILRMLNRRDRYNHIENMEYKGFLHKKSSYVYVSAVVLSLLNVYLFLVIPRGYFSTYLLFPFNFIKTTLVFNQLTIVALLMGGSAMGAILLTLSLFYDRWRVGSKEEERVAVKKSKTYQKRRENKFETSQMYTKDYEQQYEELLEIEDYEAYKKQFEELKKQILIGTDEFGKSYSIALKELNQHALIPATTGGGKTVLLELFVDHCLKFNIPCVIIDGKGAKETLEVMEKIAQKRGKKVRAFSDNHNMAYNPLKYGNSTEIKDRLVTLAETESVFYSGAAKSLLMGTIQLIDCFGISRTFDHLSDYFLPRNVLELFADKLEKLGIEVFVSYRKVETKPKKNKKKEEGNTNEGLALALETEEIDDEDDSPAEVAWEKVIYDPNEITLDKYYELVRTHYKEMPEKDRKIFKQLFIRYEHKENPFYLYATSEALQTNINMIIDSEVGDLFNVDNAENELDMRELYEKTQCVYISLNGLVYDEFITQLAHFIVGDIKHLMATIYEKTGKRREMMALFDEPASYLDDSFISIANKARGAGLHAIYSPQTLADIEKIDEKLVKQLIGNVNTFILGQTNESDEVSYWAELFGTYQDIDITEMTEQADGFNNLNKTSWTGERGTKRQVNKFIVPPDEIKDLRTGEFYFLRKGANVHEPVRKVYVRDVTRV
ncbi:type VI secretion protein [Enterococcus faecium]|nr:type VI secretion protein [Enterococcus faecium]